VLLAGSVALPLALLALVLRAPTARRVPAETPTR
jgi:hypothetical protein